MMTSSSAVVATRHLKSGSAAVARFRRLALRVRDLRLPMQFESPTCSESFIFNRA